MKISKLNSGLPAMALALLMMVAGPSALAEEPDSANIPEIHRMSLKNLQGKAQTLHDYAGKGQWLVIMIWQSDCHVCNQEAENYDAWYQANRSGDATLLGITTDGWENREDAQAFIDRHKVTFPNTLVSYDEIDRYYQTHIGRPFFGTPAFMIFHPAGEIAAEQVGAIPTDLIDKFIQQNSQQVNAGN